MISCRKCGHTWTPVVPRPLKCPSCNQPKYWQDKVRNVGDGARVSDLRNHRELRAAKVPEPALDLPSGVSRGVSSVVEQRPSSPQVAGSIPAPRTNDVIESVPTRTCSDCDGPLTESKGKWACPDQGCALYGREQKQKAGTR